MFERRLTSVQPQSLLGFVIRAGEGILVAALAGIVFSAPMKAQAISEQQSATAPRISFEVASVKPGKPGGPPRQRVDANRFTANLTLFGYITFAWNLMPSSEQTDSMLAGAPKWVSTDNFEIEAVAQGNPTKDLMRLMVQSLLADRFRLTVHTVSADSAVLALVPGKSGATGPTLRPHSEGRPCDIHFPYQDSRTNAVGVFPPACGELFAIPRPGGAVLVAARDVTVGQIAIFIPSLGLLTRPVVDQTGLRGKFDFTIEFTPERKGPPPSQDAQPDDSQATTLEEAVREQLGLKLNATNAPLETLIVDYAERPSEN